MFPQVVDARISQVRRASLFRIRLAIYFFIFFLVLSLSEGCGRKKKTKKVKGFFGTCTAREACVTFWLKGHVWLFTLLFTFSFFIHMALFPLVVFIITLCLKLLILTWVRDHNYIRKKLYKLTNRITIFDMDCIKCKVFEKKKTKKNGGGWGQCPIRKEGFVWDNCKMTANVCSVTLLMHVSGRELRTQLSKKKHKQFILKSRQRKIIKIWDINCTHKRIIKVMNCGHR